MYIILEKEGTMDRYALKSIGQVLESKCSETLCQVLMIGEGVHVVFTLINPREELKERTSVRKKGKLHSTRQILLIQLPLLYMKTLEFR